jgi:glycosyltransferase involved in cell wall biosynthesis
MFSMKVLFITNIPAPYRVEFFNELGKYCDVTVWFQAENESNRKWKLEGVGKRFKYKFLKGKTFGLDKHLNISIISELNKEHFDVYVVGCYSSPTEILAIHWLKLNNIPFMLNSDGGFPAKESRMKKWFKKYLISSAKGWLSSGKNCTDYLCYYGAQRDHVVEYPFSSVEFSNEELAPMTHDEKQDIKNKHGLKEIVVLSIGQFIHRKGFDLLIDVFSRLKDYNVSLLLIGGGEKEEEYRGLIQKLELSNVVVLDFMHKDELIKYFKTADIFVLPSRYDIWGLVLNEALAFGLPIISTNNTGAAYDLITENENGYMVNIEQAEELYEKVKELIQNESLRKHFSNNSLIMAQNYKIEKMALRHYEIFDQFYNRSILRNSLA